MRFARTLIPTLLFALIAGTSNATGPAPAAPDFSLPARNGCSGRQNATMLSWYSSPVGISTSVTAPLPQRPRGSIHRLGRWW